MQAAKFLLEAVWSEDFAPRLLVYHSRQTALLRSQEEKYLDKVLKRKGEETTEIDFQDVVVRRHIEQAKAQNIVFILVATPVEELGRDHDLDWAVVEPSSLFPAFYQTRRSIMLAVKSLSCAPFWSMTSPPACQPLVNSVSPEIPKTTWVLS